MFIDESYSKGFHYSVKKNGETIANIIGTYHVGPALSKLNPKIESEAKKAKKIAFENTFIFNRDENEINSLIIRNKSEADYYNYFNEVNYQEDKAYKYPISKKIDKVIEHSQEYGTEMLIFKNSVIISLETSKEYAKNLICIHSHRLHTKKEYIDNIISNEEVRAVNSDIYEAFQKSDEALGNQAMKWRKSHDPAFHHFITKTRNYTFAGRAVPLIEESSPESTVLIAVGYTHLLGKHGLINLFRQNLEKNIL